MWRKVEATQRFGTIAYLDADYRRARMADETARRLVLQAFTHRPLDVSPVGCGRSFRDRCPGNMQLAYMTHVLRRLAENQLRLFVISGRRGHLDSASTLVAAMRRNPEYERGSFTDLDREVLAFQALFIPTPELERSPSREVMSRFPNGSRAREELYPSEVTESSFYQRTVYLNRHEVLGRLTRRARFIYLRGSAADVNEVLIETRNLREMYAGNCNLHIQAYLDFIDARARLRIRPSSRQQTVTRNADLAIMNTLAEKEDQPLLAWRARRLARALQSPSARYDRALGFL